MTVDETVHDLAHGVHGQSELRLVGEFLEGCLADDDSDDDARAVCLKAIGWLKVALAEARAAIEKAADNPDDDTEDDDDRADE